MDGRGASHRLSTSPQSMAGFAPKTSRAGAALYVPSVVQLGGFGRRGGAFLASRSRLGKARGTIPDAACEGRLGSAQCLSFIWPHNGVLGWSSGRSSVARGASLRWRRTAYPCSFVSHTSARQGEKHIALADVGNAGDVWAEPVLECREVAGTNHTIVHANAVSLSGGSSGRSDRWRNEAYSEGSQRF